jgi:hypothetical protein
MEPIAAALLVGAGILIVLALCSRSLGKNTVPRRRRGHLNDGRELARSFSDMGNLVGKTKDDFIAAAGRPSSISQGHGYTLMQWQETGYHVAIVFNSDGTFRNVQHEHASRDL